MIIKTKFKIGDEVYYHFYGTIRRFIIVDIVITKSHIYYRDEYEWNVDEKECFATRKEAIAEYNRILEIRNKYAQEYVKRYEKKDKFMTKKLIKQIQKSKKSML